jgi:hypothetical protein
MPKWIEWIEIDKYSLEVFECDCGFHIGLDAVFLNRSGDVKVSCPSCGMVIDTSSIDYPE